ncbi:MAG: DUF2834 domain-containing protein [Gemmatimonadetes bacterium]|nr:MAG: DUF2834 domain-containing protein [Gemmatimonadota bacterium]
MKKLYLTLTIIGGILPYSQAIPWLFQNGLDLPRIIDLLFANPISAAFGLDIVISATVLMIWIIHEHKRQPVKLVWLPLIGTVVVGVSFGLPLFLYLRESSKPT